MTAHRRWSTTGCQGGRPSARESLWAPSEASYELDSRYQFVAVDEAFATITGYEDDRLLGEHASLVYPDAAVDRVETLARTLVETSREDTAGRSAEADGDGTATDDHENVENADETSKNDHGGPTDLRSAGPRVTLDLTLRTAAGDEIVCTHQLQVTTPSDGTERVVATVRTDPDGTDRPETCRHSSTGEQEPGQEGESSTGDATGVDGDRPAALSTAIERIRDGVYALDADLQYTFVNEGARDLLGLDGASDADDDPALFRTAHERAMEHQRPFTVEAYHPPIDGWIEARLYPDESGVTVHVSDRTPWRAREEGLESGYQRFRSVFEDAHDAILVGDESGIVAANPAACDLFDTSRSELRGRSLIEFVHDDHDVETAWEQFLDDGRFRGSFSVVRSDGDERVVECNAVADVRPGIHLSILRDVTETRKRERQLERQRERLTALDHVYTVVRELNDAIVTGSTRADLERIVCDSLADSPSYEFAFVAGVDPSDGAVSKRAEAGVDGYLESIPISTDPDEPAGQGPLGQAARTQETQVSNDVFTDPEFEPWRDDARERGYRAAAAVPITHDGALYGVLGVTSARSQAFTDEERTVVGQLGEILGHAIAAHERKRVLLGETVIELELVIDDAVEFFDGPSMADRSVQFDRVVSIGDDQYLEYGTTAVETFPEFERLVESVPHWDRVTPLDESGGTVRFELEITSPPMFSVIDAHGGYVESAALHDGTYTTTLHFPQDTDVRAVTDAIEEVYPGVRTIARRQVTPADASIGQLQSHLAHELTDRQRSALETAYYAGYFEWPRDSSGEEIAATLDVSPATFHEHLRSAQEKLVAAILEGPDAARPGSTDD
ncbi:bacterio-opsin activator domain-containing protein [Halosolutus amylolyticus]|uniref:Bacterio-opsin activator domain-containing protein n=1 Tax=Halosolutus amylolyticus TaxID=2932267 RepID=A0ABD5PSU2_9EURY|nr:bacterio-opsin activator domain-containing protein [Halosolutus amylolyticus]